MNFNNSIPEDINIIINSIDKEEITKEKNNKNKEANINSQKNLRSTNDINKNIFTSLPSKLEIYNINNSIYESLFIKELLKFHLQNIFCIIKNKIIIISSKVFYRLKKYSKIKIFYLIKSEILYLKISSSFKILSNIYKRRRDSKLYQIFNYIRGGNRISNNFFKIKYEIKFKKEKENLINDKILKIKKLQKEINDMEDNIRLMNLKDNELNLKIINLSKKEKQLNDAITQLDNSKNINYNRNSVNNNFTNGSEITSLESTIFNNKHQNEEKQKIINNFIFKVGELLNEYQEYIELLNSNKSNSDTFKNNINTSSNDNSKLNKLSIKSNDKDESSNTWNSSKISLMKNKIDLYKDKPNYKREKDNKK